MGPARDALLAGPLLASSTRPDALERAQLARQLAVPWCWPGRARTRLADRARELGFAAPEAPCPGEVLLLSTTPDGRFGALWAATPRPLAPGRVDFGERAREAHEVARAHALRDLPLLGRWDERALVRPTARRITQEFGVPAAETLDGGSFGLAFALGVLSQLLEQPVDARWAACARLDAAGVARPVEGLAAKLRVLRAAGLGVSAVVVAAEQAEEAQRLLEDTPALGVHGVASLHEATELVFPDLEAAAQQRWAALADDEARERARALFRIALGGSPVFRDWRGVRRTADHAAAHVPEDVRDLVRIAGTIAARHAHEDAPLGWPEDLLAALNRPTRLELTAHLVQAAADSEDDATVRERAARGRSLVAPAALERHPEDLKVLGAIGRALAGIWEFADAARALTEAVEGWLALDRAPDASLAVCELLRVRGIQGDHAGFEALDREVLPRVLGSVQAPAAARAFVRLARGRSLCQLGRFADAAGALDGASAPAAGLPWHVQGAQMRWLARALAAGGESERATALRARLEALHRQEAIRRRPGETTTLVDQPLLAAIDAALEGGPPLDPLLRRIREEPELRFPRRDLERCPKEWETARAARAVADRSRY